MTIKTSKMKRMILRFCTATALLMPFTSCQSELDGGFDQNTIRFSTDIISTKGTLINKFPDGGTFGVLGYCFVNGASGSSDWNTKKVQAKPDIFYNQAVTYTAATGCTYNPLHAWSGQVTDKYTFFAYYPHNATGITLSPETQVGAPVLTYDMPFDSNKETKVLDIKAVPDVMVANTIDHTSNRGRVNFNFTHLLTAFEFGVNNFKPAESITIESVKVFGTFNKTLVANMENGSATYKGEYKGTFEIVNTSNKKIIVPNRETGMEYLTNKTGDNYLLLVPQTLSAADFTNKKWQVSITFSSPSVKTKTQTFTIGTSGGNKTYSAGIRYTVSFDFIGDVCTMRVRSDDAWEKPDGEDNDVEFE